jgi:hypothetical protein
LSKTDKSIANMKLIVDEVGDAMRAHTGLQNEALSIEWLHRKERPLTERCASVRRILQKQRELPLLQGRAGRVPASLPRLPALEKSGTE